MTKTPEQWAQEKGMAFRPVLIPGHKGQPSRLGQACPMLAGAMQHNKWTPGEPLTEEQFTDGLAAFEGVVLQ